MSRAKYIVWESPDGLELCVIFPMLIDHSEMAKKLNVTPISAGRIDFVTDCRGDSAPSCINGSTTLGIEFDINRSALDEDAAWFSLMKDE